MARPKITAPTDSPAPDDTAAARAQAEADALRKTAQMLQETRGDHDDDKYW